MTNNLIWFFTGGLVTCTIIFVFDNKPQQQLTPERAEDCRACDRVLMEAAAYRAAGRYKIADDFTKAVLGDE